MDNPPVNNPPVDNPPVNNPPVEGLTVDSPAVGSPAVGSPVVGSPAVVALPEILSPAFATSIRPLLAAQVAPAVTTHPLPTAAAAGDVSTGGQLLAGGSAALAAVLAFGAAFVQRRRHGDA